MENFEKGNRVKYIPTHANGNLSHPDCEEGTVSSQNKTGVFVHYDNSPNQSKLTYRENLVLI